MLTVLVRKGKIRWMDYPWYAGLLPLQCHCPLSVAGYNTTGLAGPPGDVAWPRQKSPPLMFTIISGAMILVGIMGVRPVVSIAIVSPLLLPRNPNHSQCVFEKLPE
jgi:hypothetical protein